MVIRGLEPRLPQAHRGGVAAAYVRWLPHRTPPGPSEAGHGWTPAVAPSAWPAQPRPATDQLVFPHKLYTFAAFVALQPTLGFWMPPMHFTIVVAGRGPARVVVIPTPRETAPPGFDPRSPGRRLRAGHIHCFQPPPPGPIRSPFNRHRLPQAFVGHWPPLDDSTARTGPPSPRRGERNCPRSLPTPTPRGPA